MKLAFELEVPDGAVDKSAQADLVRSVKEQTVLKLYSEQRVTTGEAAGMLGQTRIEFLDLLRSSGLLPWWISTEEDFAQLRRWRKDHDRRASERGRFRQQSPELPGALVGLRSSPADLRDSGDSSRGSSRGSRTRGGLSSGRRCPSCSWRMDFRRRAAGCRTSHLAAPRISIGPWRR